jgi:hypothetical protein
MKGEKMEFNIDELAERVDIATSTFYKWKKTKPELIKLLLLGLQKEKEINNNMNELSNLDKTVGDIIPTIKALEEKIKALEEKMN